MEATATHWAFTDGDGTLAGLPLPQVPQPNAATALAALRASRLNIDEQAIRDGYCAGYLTGTFSNRERVAACYL
ncbi:folylpolyglutamate synthase [Salmonella enterica subsp. arizonae]|uniref:Folylpolyglutamate synthase n=1 Tax=Salmonella enterica subsp. arizonae TaxID=59203 RepID=A0A379T9B1_SALER|nr:folylpolyglutamate synthase [Salmonella enterica subsp. arizonae]